MADRPESRHSDDSTRAPSDPVDRLRGEHDVILCALDAVEAEAGRLADGGALHRDFWIRAADFIEDFVAGFHHNKEEDLLFPRLIEYGLSERRGPIAVLRHEHDSERWLQDRLLRAVRRGDRPEIAQSARAFTYRMRVHIDNENRVLLEMARVALEGERAERLAAEFDEAERALARTHEHFVDAAKRLCQRAGVPFETDA